jgi:hypothetical protein
LPWLLPVKTIEVVQKDSKLWNRRVSRIAERPGEGRLTQPTAAFQPSQAEPLFMLRVFGRLPVTDSATR